jgi:hypothetical protein
MANLYEIDTQITECFDADTGELLDAEKLENLMIEKENKFENVALWIKNLKADAAMYKAEKTAFAERQAAAERKAESLTMWLKNALGGKKFKTEKAEVNFRKTQKVEVLDIWELNEDFVKYSDPTPDKAAIKRAIKAGEDVKGAKLIDDISMTIK